MNKLPNARTENIIVQNLDNEVLIYDINTNHAFCLNETSAKVYNHCDGQTLFDELKSKYKFTDDLIFLALDELRKENLLDEKIEYASSLAGMSRREAIRQVGLATMVALPVITALVAPIAADAQSGNTCTSNVCFAPGANVCAGCQNRNISITQFNSTNGSCLGTFISTNPALTCGTTPRTATNDVRRN